MKKHVCKLVQYIGSKNFLKLQFLESYEFLHKEFQNLNIKLVFLFARVLELLFNNKYCTKQNIKFEKLNSVCSK